MTNYIQDFLQKDLLVELNLQDLPNEKKEKFILQVGEIIQKNLVMRVISEMSESDKDEFEIILKKESPEKTQEFLQEKCPNLDEILKEEISKFKQQTIATMSGITK